LEGSRLDRGLNPWRYNADGSLTPRARAQDAGGANAPAGGGAGQVTVDPAILTRGSAAAGEVHGQLTTAGRVADDTTAAAASGLNQENFQLGPSLRITGELWNSQMTTLIQACHKIEQSLAANARGYRMAEDANEMRMADIARHFE
jgi:hypothetical protein